MFSVRFHFLFWTAVTVSAKELLYGKIGDKVVLTPDSVVNPITSIEWKHGLDLAIDWYGGEPTAYRHFKVRGSLNISNGELTITGLTPDDRGIYTVEISNKVTSKTQLLVISAVPKPNISVSCDPEMTSCVLTCNGDTTDAGPVTHEWTSGDTTLASTKEHKITAENKEPWFSCTFENPVSNISSDKVSNPFIIKSDPTRMYISIAAFTVFLVFCVIVIIYLIYRKQRTKMLPTVQNPSNPDLTPFVTQNTSNGTEGSATTPDVHETSLQVHKTAESPDPSNGTVKSTIPEVHKTSTQETVESPDTSNGTERPENPESEEETSNQVTTSTEPPEPSNETVNSEKIPDVPETCRLLIDEQTADPEDEAQS